MNEVLALMLGALVAAIGLFIGGVIQSVIAVFQ